MPESQLSPFLSRELCRGKEQVVQSGHLEEQKKNATNFMVKWISFFPSLTFTRRHSLPPPLLVLYIQTMIWHFRGSWALPSQNYNIPFFAKASCQGQNTKQFECQEV